MESIERVAHTYIQLCRDGCLLFHNWAVKFYFGVDRPVCCIIGFFLSDDQTSQQLKGMRHSSTIEDYIAQVNAYIASVCPLSHLLTPNRLSFLFIAKVHALRSELSRHLLTNASL